MATAAQPRYRARVVPRGEGGSRASRIRWDRFGRIVLVLVLFAVLISYIGPTMHVFDSWRESRAADQQLATLKDENERLSRQAHELEKPAAAIAEARKLGMIGPGEKAYVIDGLK
jgi:cell division protein FtsB